MNLDRVSWPTLNRHGSKWEINTLDTSKGNQGRVGWRLAAKEKEEVVVSLLHLVCLYTLCAGTTSPWEI